MTSHSLSIARATFAAGLLRPDASSTPVSRDGISDFQRLLDTALVQCSPSNVQTCKVWLLKYITTSSARIGAFGKYLTAVSRSVGTPSTDGSNEDKERAKSETSPRRKRLHALYLLNDLLHHTKYHERESSVHASLTSNIQPHLVDLISIAASAKATKYPKLTQRIYDLLRLWADNGYYAKDFINKLRQAAENASTLGDTQMGDAQRDAKESASSGTSKLPRNIPYVMPATHGDASTPWYDLPAGNMMPHIVPNRTVPINTALMKPLKFLAGPAEPGLENAVKSFLEGVERIYDTRLPVDEGIVADIDEMGEPVLKDGETGDLIPSNTYYGWSRDFCERMNTRRREGPPDGNGSRGERRSRSTDRFRSSNKIRSRSRSTSRDRSRFRSRSRNNGPNKRRRYSSSRSRSRSRSRYRRRDRSYSRSRSVSRGRYRGYDRRSRSPGGRYPGSRSPDRRHRESGSRSSRRRSRSGSRSAPRERDRYRHHDYDSSLPGKQSLRPLPQPTFQASNTCPPPNAPSGPPTQFSQQNFQPLPPLLNSNFPFPMGPDGMPMIPPRPPGYTGPWPPPPPPMPAGGANPIMNFSTSMIPTMPNPGFVPPLPPMQMQQQGFGGMGSMPSMGSSGQWGGPSGNQGSQRGGWHGGMGGRGGGWGTRARGRGQ